MSKKSVINKNHVKGILKMAECGMTVNEIAAAIALPVSSTGKVVALYKAIVNDSEIPLWALSNKEITAAVYGYAGKTVPAKVESPAPAPEKEQKPVIDCRNPQGMDLYMQTLLVRLAETNELLTQLMDTVMKPCFDQLRQSIDLNTDIICQNQKDIATALEGIKCTVKKAAR